LANKMLAPVFMNVRTSEGTIEERIKAAVDSLSERLSSLAAQTSAVEADVAAAWNLRFLELAPGTLVLENVTRKYGVTFSKANGDSEHLAKHVGEGAIPHELVELLREVTREDKPASKAAIE